MRPQIDSRDRLGEQKWHRRPHCSGVTCQCQHAAVVSGVGLDVEDAKAGDPPQGGCNPVHHIGAGTFTDIRDTFDDRHDRVAFLPQLASRAGHHTV
jgi:hypothetical protein